MTLLFAVFKSSVQIPPGETGCGELLRDHVAKSRLCRPALFFYVKI